MIVTNDKLARTDYVKDKKLIVSVYKGRVDNETFLEHLTKVAAFYKHNKIKVAIIDLRKLYGSFIKIMDYMDGSFYPIAAKSGLKAQAFILTDDLILKNLVKKLELMATNFDIQVRTFLSKEEADTWINTII